MSDRNTTGWSRCARQPWQVILAGLALTLSASAMAQTPPRGPEELRGKVAGVAGDRVQIAFDQPQWLPRAGSVVTFGAEMAGMFVPLKGDFVIVQVGADTVFAMAAGKTEHGTPAAGMLAVVKTAYPHHPLSHADYVSSREKEAAVMRWLTAASRRPSTSWPWGTETVATMTGRSPGGSGRRRGRTTA